MKKLTLIQYIQRSPQGIIGLIILVFGAYGSTIYESQNKVDNPVIWVPIILIFIGAFLTWKYVLIPFFKQNSKN